MRVEGKKRLRSFPLHLVYYASLWCDVSHHSHSTIPGTSRIIILGFREEIGSCCAPINIIRGTAGFIIILNKPGYFLHFMESSRVF